MLRDFLAWWAEQMVGLVPLPLRLWAGGLRSALLVAVDNFGGAEPASIAVTLRRGQRERDIGRFALDDQGLRAARERLARIKRPGSTVLRLGRGPLLEREVALPIAAEREPAGILSYEMDRLTPFSAEEVFWAWRIERRDRAHGRLLLRLSVVPRNGLRSVLAALDRLGIAPGVLEALSSAGDVRVIPLDRPRAGRSRLDRAVAAVALAGCIALGIAALAAPFVRQAVARANVERRIETLKPRIEQVEALRARIAGNGAGADVIAAERARFGDPLRVIATLTEILPDDTFLTELQLRRGRLGLNGQAAAAARLIPALAAEPTLKNPVFAAPVTRTENGQADIFSIAAELGPER